MATTCHKTSFHDHVSHIPCRLSAFPQAKGWDSAGDLPGQWSLVRPGIASLIFNGNLYPSRIDRKVVGERWPNPIKLFLDGCPAGYNFFFTLLMTSRVLILIWFTLSAMFFRPSTYNDLLQWVSTCVNCFARNKHLQSFPHLLRSRKGRWTHTTATLRRLPGGIHPTQPGND